MAPLNTSSLTFTYWRSAYTIESLWMPVIVSAYSYGQRIQETAETHYYTPKYWSLDDFSRCHMNSAFVCHFCYWVKAEELCHVKSHK